MKKGTVKVYSPDVSAGVIICEEGKNHIFFLKDWLSHGEPKPDTPVQFEAERQQARKIQAAEGV